MSIEEWSQQITIAHLAGDAQLTDELVQLSEQVAERAFSLVLDMAVIRYMNSSHLAKILKLRKLLVGSDRRLVLAKVHPQVFNTFLVTGLDKIFEFADTATAGAKCLEPADSKIARKG
jgi:anti-anti-sigma factor